MTGRRQSRAIRRARLLGLALLILFIPVPMPAATAFNTGQAIEQFFECTDPVGWQNCASGIYHDGVTSVKVGTSFNEEPSKFGFKFPSKGVASSADFDIHTEYGYRNRFFLENSQGQWNNAGVNASNTTSLFGLRLDLDGAPPNGPSAVSPFALPVATNPNVTFAAGAFAHDTATGDFDSDGDDDIAVLAGAAVQVRRFQGGNWLNYTNFPIPTGTAQGIVASDLNGDGRMDAVVNATSSSTTYLYALVQMPWGGMRLEGPMLINSGGTPTMQGFDVGDLTGDGKPDVAMIYSNRTVYWAPQGAGNNLDFWGASTYSIKLASLAYTNAPSSAAAAPAPCNATVAGSNLDGRTYVYWQSNFTLITTLIGHASSVNAVAWSPDCQYLATGSNDRNVVIWQTSNWTIAANLSGHSNSVYSLAFSPDSARLASGGADSTVVVWNTTAFPPTMDANISENNGTIYALAFSPNNSYLVAGTGNNVVRVHSTADFTSLYNLTGHAFAARSLAFAPNGTELASGSLDDRVFLWDMDLLTKTGELTQATADINQVSYAPNGTRLVAASSDGHMRLYRTSDWSLMDDVTEGSVFVYATAFDRNGGSLISGGTNNYLRLWDRSTLVSQSRTYTGQEFSGLTVAYSTDGRLAVGSDDGTVAIWQLSSASVTTTFRAHDGVTNRVVWSPSAAYLATAGTDGRIHVFDTATWGYTANVTLNGNVTGLDWSDTGDVLAAANATGGIGAWLMPANTSLNTMSSVTGVNALALDPTGASAAVAGTDGVIRLFNLSSRWNYQNLTASGVQKGVDWSPDGTLIAAGGVDRRSRSWWTSNGTLNSNVLQHTSDITSVAFAPDSTRFATGGFDQRIFVFNRSGAVVQQYGSAPSGGTLLLSVAWAPDAKTIAGGWHTVRFPIARQNLCGSICGSSITTYGIAVGPVDGTSGNDIVFVGHLKCSFCNVESAIVVLGFSGGAPSAFSAIAPPSSNYVPDAYRIALGDLTGDGRNDLAVAGDLSPSGSLFMIAWDSSLTPARYDTSNILSLPIGGSTNEIKIADVTDDGRNDVILVAGFGSNQVQVAYYEPYARQTGLLRYANVSKLMAPASADAPAGFSIGHFNNDSLLDIAAANGAANSVWIWLQKDQLFGYFISQPLSDAVFIGDPIVSAKLWWDDWNVVPAFTTFNVSLTLNNGFTWTPIQENVTVDLNGTNASTMKYRVDFFADKAGVTPWILAIQLDYTVQTTPYDLSMDILRDFQPPNGECFWGGVALGDFHCSFPATIINQYVLDNFNLRDANGSIYMPIRIRWQRPATVTLSNLSIPFNKNPAAPELVVPPPDTFVDATPTFVIRAADSDSDNLRYHVQVAADAGFVSVVRSFSQNDTAVCWGLPFYVASSNATCTTPASQRLNNGQRYFWRVSAFDGLQWSDWSLAQNFTVDDLPPDGFASSPPYSTTETFTVSWLSTDPAGGAGLAAAPYDVQFKDGIEGAWTDLLTTTALTSTNFVGQNGHTYCFHMRATDAAGNPQLYSVGETGDTCTVIDTDKPSATIEDLPAFEITRNFEVAWSGTDGVGGSGVGGYDVQVMPEGGAWGLWLTGFGGTSAVYSAPDDRVYTFRVAARDRAGNLGTPSSTAATRVDTTAPVCQVTAGSATITNLEQIAITMACSDEQTGVAAYEYCVGGGPSACDEKVPTRTASPVPLITELTLANGGTYYVSVRGLNNAGGWSAWSSTTAVRVVIPGPASSIDYEAGVWTETALNVTFSSSDALGYEIVAGELQYRRAAFRYNQLGDWQDWLTVVVDPGARNYSFEGQNIIIRGYAYEFRFRARNEVGSWGEHATGGRVSVNHLPVAAGGSDRLVNISQEVLLDASASLDYDGERDALTFQWETDTGDVIPPGPTARVVFTTPGTHRATLTVSDGHESTTAVVHIEVLPDPPRQVAPGFEGPLLLMALIGVALLAGVRRRKRRD